MGPRNAVAFLLRGISTINSSFLLRSGMKLLQDLAAFA
jgi:hypothetical protein